MQRWCHFTEGDSDIYNCDVLSKEARLVTSGCSLRISGFSTMSMYLHSSPGVEVIVLGYNMIVCLYVIFNIFICLQFSFNPIINKISCLFGSQGNCDSFPSA